MAMSNPICNKSGKVSLIAVVIVVVLALIIAFCCSLAVSANRALGLVSNANDAYNGACSSLENGNFEEARDSARSAIDSIRSLSKELDSPQWNIAAALPVLGDDVKTAREMSSIAVKLADEAVSPVFDQWDALSQTLDDDDLSNLGKAGAILEKAPQFVETLSHAKQVVYECEEQANSLPTAHIDQLNDASKELKKTMTTIGDMLRIFDRVVDSIMP